MVSCDYFENYFMVYVTLAIVKKYKVFEFPICIQYSYTKRLARG
jgi:hypothetical protein